MIVDQFPHGQGTVEIHLIEQEDRIDVVAKWQGGGFVNGFGYSIEKTTKVDLAHFSTLDPVRELIKVARADVERGLWDQLQEALKSTRSPVEGEYLFHQRLPDGSFNTMLLGLDAGVISVSQIFGPGGRGTYSIAADVVNVVIDFDVVEGMLWMRDGRPVLCDGFDTVRMPVPIAWADGELHRTTLSNPGGPTVEIFIRKVR